MDEDGYGDGMSMGMGRGMGMGIGGSGPKRINICCYLLHLSNMDPKVRGIHNDYEMLSDFVLIFTRANSKYTHSS